MRFSLNQPVIVVYVCERVGDCHTSKMFPASPPRHSVAVEAGKVADGRDEHVCGSVRGGRRQHRPKRKRVENDWISGYQQEKGKREGEKQWLREQARPKREGGENR